MWARRECGGEVGRFADVPGLGNAIDSLLVSGAAFAVALTSDGGAISLTCLVGGDKERLYVHGQGELDDAINELAKAFLPKAE